MHSYTSVDSTSWLDKIIYPELFKVPTKCVALCIYLSMCHKVRHTGLTNVGLKAGKLIRPQLKASPKSTEVICP